MSPIVKRIAITFVILAIPLLIGLLFTYQIIRIDWLSTLKIQPAYRPMDNPLPLPAQSVPIEGAVFVPLAGSPSNPIKSDQASLARGQFLFGLNCAACHGFDAKGDGSFVDKMIRKPADLTGALVKDLSDGEIFLVITNGVNPGVGIRGGMPPLNENLAASDRWDIVNYVRSLQGH